MSVYRIYVEKKAEFAGEAQGVYSAIVGELGIADVTSVRLFNRYDVEGISKEHFDLARNTVFSEPPVDNTYDELPAADGAVFATEYLPGQFDQRADSCAQCLQLVAQSERPTVRSARVYIVDGSVSKAQLEAIKSYLINPVEAREASLDMPKTLKTDYAVPETVQTINGFMSYSDEQLEKFIAQYGLAMEADDAMCCREYFRDTEHRDPTITEIKMIDTYWSDHCRHTTFATNIDEVDISTDYIKDAYNSYLELRKTVHAGKNKPVTLMDLATIGAKALKASGDLADLDVSEEINACSVKIKVDHDGVLENWLLMFKNETHNHPTEIEPFGGAATCLGGAIRDPLSGRSYVYQAMRLTGAGNPLAPNSETLAGKLPQRKIVTTAAAGYSSYGNQIGLATGHVSEMYHPGYVAKRMEVGAVIGAAPENAVVREVPCAGDIIILLGGATGRDGCGGATGSSKSHTASSLESCGAEVQKGNAPEERKIQRLFRNAEVTRLIKRCNDFGAGGVSVAIGELADGLEINLDAVPKKYDGLDGTELAISESQERMAVVVAKENAEKFVAAAEKENLTATTVAVVTDKNRLVMDWNGRRIVDLSRDFLNSNGATKHISVKIASAKVKQDVRSGASTAKKWLDAVSDLNVCSQKGLVQRFDSTIGGGTVLLPFGGAQQLSPSQAMAAKLPVLDGKTTTCSLMAWGLNPYISEQSPYHGAMLAVVESIAKLVAAGADSGHCWLSFQEYFERLGKDSASWGKPFAALLGALKAQLELKAGAIGGKDSMSGSFEELHVPPTLISFAVSTANIDNIISTEFKKSGSHVYLLTPKYDSNLLPDFASIREVFATAEKLISQKKAISAWAVTMGGVCEGITKMSMGNCIGFTFADDMKNVDLFAETAPASGGIILECTEEIPELTLLGTTTDKYEIVIGNEKIDGRDMQKAWEDKLSPVYPYKIPTPKITVPTYSYTAKERIVCGSSIAKPRVLIPVFPGSNCEYDVARCFEQAGAKAEIFVVRNRNAAAIEQSVAEFAALVGKSNIISIPGGFSGGDEPDGSGKFITAFFRSPRIKEAVTKLLEQDDGLVNGICNGFQALIKLGLVPYGKIVDMDETCPTLTNNKIGRHQSTMIRTRVSSNKSPWLMNCEVGEIHTIALSHGEGRFICSDDLLAELADNGQIATQYVDLAGTPSLDVQFNPNSSYAAVEGITSPDGRVFGKMAHFERYSEGVYKNIGGEKFMPVFSGAVDYFTK